MPQHFASDDAIDDLVRDFLALRLSKPRWTHAAHFATALWMLRRHGLAEASRTMPGLIRAYNESVGERRHAGLSRDDHPGVAAQRSFDARRGAAS